MKEHLFVRKRKLVKQFKISIFNGKKIRIHAKNFNLNFAKQTKPKLRSQIQMEKSICF